MIFENLGSVQKSASVIDCPYRSDSNSSLDQSSNQSAFKNLQILMLQLLQDYWLPKYITHVTSELKSNKKLHELGLDQITGPKNSKSVLDFVHHKIVCLI